MKLRNSSHFSLISSQTSRLIKYMQHLALSLGNCRHIMQKRIIKKINLKVKVEINYPSNFKNLAKIKTIKKHNKKHLRRVILYFKFKLNLV